MAVTNQELFNIFLENPNLSDTQILSLMKTRGISPEQVSSTFGMPINDVIARLAPVVPPNEAVLLGDTYVQSVYDVLGSGQDQQLGGLKNIITYKAGENQVGGAYNQYLPSGVLERAGTQQAVDANKDFLKFLAGSAALFGGAALAGAGGTTAATGATAAELAQANMALGGVGGTAGATELAGALATGAPTVATTALTGGSGLITGANAGITAESVAAKLAADSAASGSTGLLTGTTTGATTAATTAATAAATGLTTTQVADLVKTGLTTAQIANLFSTGATTAAGLLQQQTSREAAQKAQAMIDAETAAAKQAAQFRPIGMTTRFGASQFGFDPKTGQLTSAGYTLSPEAKAAQDRFVKLAESGIQQAEGAQKAFEPLQTGAQSLFKLGQGYLAEKPEDVAKNYLASQMALLQPGRETELANLQNRLQQQGRGGLSVAQGGTMGATTPELQALYNARAQQEAQLAAQAQQAGQQQVAFGAGLLGTGAQTMGQYYGGQQQAYAPFTTALGQVQGLEQLAQQPLQMGASLGQQASAAGARMGELGLRGAGQSVALATGSAATRNPYATALFGLADNPLFGQTAAGLFGTVPPVTAMSAPATTFGTGTYYGNQDLGLFL